MPDCNQFFFSIKTYLIIILLIVVPFIGGASSVAQTDSISQRLEIKDSVTLLKDSVTPSKDSIKTQDSIAVKPPKKSTIDAEINYTAQDSIVFLSNGTGFLYGAGDMTYQKINLKADYIRVKLDSSTIFARGVPDSVGNLNGTPEFTDGDQQFSSKELTYNLSTRKAFVRQAVTQQGEGYIISEKTKMNTDEELYIEHGKYTTCDNHDHPHFYLSLSKGKVKPGSHIVSGPAHMVIADVPLPLIIPFGFFPFNTQYSSGFLMPTYADELTRGLGLINGGYYFAFNDYVDLEMRGDIYTKGTWGVNATSSYIKRYKFNGRFYVSYREDVTGEKDMPDYQKAKNLNITWSHSQDQKANPYMTLSANVNFSTSGYNRSNINSYYNPNLNSENTKASSVSFSKRFPRIPSLSLTGAMNVTQRTKDSTISMTLPDISVSYSSTKPFKRKVALGNEQWYEKITVSYSGVFQNSVSSIKENKLLNSSFTRDWQNAARHTIPVNATFSMFNVINITPSINYTERWYTRSIEKSWNTLNQAEVIDTVDGFRRVFDFNVGVSASTKLYGFFTPLFFRDKVQMIRHVLTPSISYTFRPDFGEPMWNYYGTYVKTIPDPNNPGVYREQEVTYSYFEGSMYGTPGRGRSQSINFSLGNNLEMKVNNPNDTTGKQSTKIRSLIDNFSVNGAYNLAADSMNWSNFSANLRMKLGSYTLSLSGAFDPYLYGLTEPTTSNPRGNPVRINQLRWNHGKFPRFLGTSTSYSYTLNNDTFKKLFGKGKEAENNDNAGENNDSGNENLEDPNNPDRQRKPESNTKAETDNFGYEKVNIPWSISISYTVSYGNTSEFDYDKMEYNQAFKHNLSFSGNISFTNNWRASTSISYDFEAKKFAYTSVNVSRSLHCWSMSANFVPFGTYKSYNFHIGVNASMLQDLKYDKQNRGNNQITWY